MNQEIAERYTYLPNCGLMVVLSTSIITYPVLIAAFLMMYATKMWFYMDAYADEYYLIEYSCMHSPDSWFSWHIRALKRWETQSYREAMILWTMAKILSPKEFKILFNLATVLMIANQKEEAMAYLKLAEDNIPGGQEIQVGDLIKHFKEGKLAILI